MKSLLNKRLIIVFVAIGFTRCKKSESAPPPPPPPPCTLCVLTANRWNLGQEVITTDVGNYSYTADQISNIHWASFVFNWDHTWEDHASDVGTYVYYDGTSNTPPTLVLTPPNGGFSFNFTIGSISSDSLTLDLPKLQVHPLTDFSPGAVAEDNIFLSELAGNFGVDTSKVQWVQPVFKYHR